MMFEYPAHRTKWVEKGDLFWGDLIWDTAPSRSVKFKHLKKSENVKFEGTSCHFHFSPHVNFTTVVTLESGKRRQYGGLPHYLYSDTFLLLGMFYVHVFGGFACLCHGGICCAQGWHVYEIAKHCPRLGNLRWLHPYFHSCTLPRLWWTISLLAPGGYWVSMQLISH